MRFAILVRHGESASNELTVLSSRTGSYPLTKKGIKQAEKAASQLSGLNVARIYTSPITRTMETSSIISRKFQIEPEIREEIRETEFGISEGKLFPGKISELTDDEREAMGIESWSSHVRRMRSFFSGLHENSIIVSHGFLIKTFVSDLLGLDSDESYGISIRFATLTVVTIPEAKILAIGAIALSEDIKMRLTEPDKPVS